MPRSEIKAGFLGADNLINNKQNNVMIHTSASLKAQDTEFENYHYQLSDGEQYELTTDELGWLDFINGKYSIAEHLRANMVGNVYTVDTFGMSEALEADGISYKAVMLSDDSALQAIFFYSNHND